MLKQDKSWKLLPLCDILSSAHPISLVGSNVFKMIQKAWEIVKKNITNCHFIKDGNRTIMGHRSIWWNLEHKDKPLALIKGYSTKGWGHKGINYFNDILKDGYLKDWNDLSEEINLPPRNWRTYTVLKDACKIIQFPMEDMTDNQQWKPLKESECQKNLLHPN